MFAVTTTVKPRGIRRAGVVSEIKHEERQTQRLGSGAVGTPV